MTLVSYIHFPFLSISEEFLMHTLFTDNAMFCDLLSNLGKIRNVINYSITGVTVISNSYTTEIVMLWLLFTDKDKMLECQSHPFMIEGWL